MKMRIALLVVLLTIAACKKKITSADIEREIPASFKEVTGYDVKRVSVIKEDDYLYTGFVILTDDSKAQIEVKIDKEKGDDYIWTVTTPSPTMYNDMLNQVSEDWDKEIDSAFAEFDK